MSKALRIGLVGVGQMGSNHLRNLMDMQVIDLVGVVEPDEASQARAAARGARVLHDIGALIDLHPEAAVVAVPSNAHAQVAIPLLKAGIACLVEKPLASTVDQAHAIVSAAEASGSALAVGHIERHNPAVGFLKGLIARGAVGRVLALDAYRTGPMPGRIRDVGVIFDLLSHDLDIACWLLQGQPESLRVDPFGWTPSPRREAGVHVVARFPVDVLVTIDASWLHPAKTRRLHCLGEEGLISIDYIQQEVRLTKNEHKVEDWGPLAGLTGGTLGEQIRYSIPRREPLRVELEMFVATVRGHPSASVSGTEGLAIVRLLDELSRLISY